MRHRISFLSVCSLALLTSCAASRDSAVRLDLWGDPAPLAAAERTIVITSSTQYINVVGGETIKFVVGDKAFAWNFDGITEGYRFKLNLAAPPQLLDHTVIAYVDPNPQYPNGR